MTNHDEGAAPSTLRRQLSITLTAAGAALLLVLTAAVYSLTQVIALQGRVTGFSYEVIASGDELYGWLEDASTALDSFVTVGYEPTLAPLDASPESATRSVRTALVDELGTGSPRVAELDSAVAAARAWHQEYAEPVLAIARAGGSDAVPADLDRLGASLHSAARAEAQTFTQALRADRDLAAHELSSWTQALFFAVVLLSLAALGAGLGVWFTLRRRILEPLADLAAKAETVSAGSLDQAVRTRAPGEIASLANAVDSMRVALVDQMAAASASRAEIAEAHRQVTEQAEELRRSNRDLEQFAYVASHDLQEPLRKVASFTQLLQKRYGGQLDERADQYIEFAVDGAKRMQRLIQDLLGFSRVGRSLDEPRPVELAGALQAALVNLEPMLEGRGARVEVSDLPTVLGQPTLLVQLFQNLVGNAVKFSAPDRSPVVQVGAVRRGSGWELWCTDNGIGVDAQYADRIFVIFQRLHPKDVYAGTGIGLALCKKIVEYHGGDIWVDTTPHDPDGGTRGTTIRWTHPDPVEAPTGEVGVNDAVVVELSSSTDASTSTDDAAEPTGRAVENPEERQ
ncbi:ATP-binding protein [Sanguibacter sp. 25GB23B1]|uniref:sensor histidine kinase n=1 Tax=unclassified Sanguibacter TaxID=2645534 RepID=UPI0032B01C98